MTERARGRGRTRRKTETKRRQSKQEEGRPAAKNNQTKQSGKSSDCRIVESQKKKWESHRNGKKHA